MRPCTTLSGTASWVPQWPFSMLATPLTASCSSTRGQTGTTKTTGTAMLGKHILQNLLQQEKTKDYPHHKATLYREVHRYTSASLRYAAAHTLCGKLTHCNSVCYLPPQSPPHCDSYIQRVSTTSYTQGMYHQSYTGCVPPVGCLCVAISFNISSMLQTALPVCMPSWVRHSLHSHNRPSSIQPCKGHSAYCCHDASMHLIGVAVLSSKSLPTTHHGTVLFSGYIHML